MYAHVLRKPVPEGEPDPAGTNGGWPTFVSHPAAKIVAAAAVATHTPKSTPASVLADASEFARRVNLNSLTTLAYGLGGRSGPYYKWAPAYTTDGSATWTATSEWIGKKQRNRVIQMACPGINLLLRPFFMYLKTARARLPGLYRTGVTDSIRWPTSHQFECDISGYDTSVWPELQDYLCEEIRAVFPPGHPLHELAPFWRAAESYPLIVPSWALDNDLCDVISYDGATRSGLKTTSEIGTLISLADALAALWAQGRCLNWPYDQHDHLLVQGDDVQLSSTKGALDTDAWTASYADVGLNATLFPGDSFLSRHNVNGIQVPSPMRVIQQTMSNEHEPDAPTAVGLLYLGLYARTAGASAWPTEVTQLVWSVLRIAAFIRALPAADTETLADFRRWVRTSREASDAIALAIASAAGEAWMSELWRDAEHSPSDAAIVAALKAAGYSPQTFSLNAEIDAAMKRASSASRLVRAGIFETGYHAVASGGTHADRWLADFLGHSQSTHLNTLLQASEAPADLSA